MSPEPENKVFEVEKHLDTPWYALHKFDGFTFKAKARPLKLNEIEQIIEKMTGKSTERRDFAYWLQEENTSILNHSDNVAIVLDGRAKDSPQGFLGDMIEASRMVNAIRSAGKTVTVVTPHIDLFDGNHDSAIKIVPLPESVPTSHTSPWKQELLSYLQETIGNTPCLFPMNAATPTLIQLGPGGIIQNHDSLALVKEAYRTNGKNPTITPLHWGRYGIHQLQAFQTTSYLLGINGTEDWQQFPKAFLTPTQQAHDIARKVVKMYGCFESKSKNCPPLYLHPGVATNGSKLVTKFYPEERWKEFINLFSATSYTTGSITFLEPTDEEQAAMTLRLATSAVDAGLRVAKVPMSIIKRKYDWNLGSFVSFLQELSLHRGIIVGCDSMPAGHAGPATGNLTIVLGSHCYDPGFYCPPERALVVLPSKTAYTSSTEPERIVSAIQYLCKNPQL